MKLAKDGKSCLKNQVILLYTAQNEVRGVELGRPIHHLIPAIPYPATVFPNHITFMASSQQIFWLDVAGPSWPHLQVVRRANIGTEDSQVKVIIDLGGEGAKGKLDYMSVSPRIGGLSVDWITGTLFYSSLDEEQIDSSGIYAAKLDGTSTVKIKDLPSRVKDLVVIPELGVLFWHDVNAENGTENVMRSWMDGTGIQSVYTVPSLEEEEVTGGLIRCLTYSTARGILYWIHGDQLKQLRLATGQFYTFILKILY